MRPVSRLLLFVLFLAAGAVTACGQKGDLYLEPQQSPATTEDSSGDDEDGER